jgi:predicted MPP superfamily phosphohydrolase
MWRPGVGTILTHLLEDVSMKKISKKQWIICIIAVVLLVLVVWTVWANTALEINEYTIVSNRLPNGFSGFCIAQVSDLHNAQMGDDNEKLLAMLREAEPDIIVLTGDMVDSRSTDIGIALRFAEDAMKIASCYYVTGNHEARISEYEDLKTGLESAGVVVLENKRIELQRNGETIMLIGVDDPSFRTDYLMGDSAAVMSDALNSLTENDAYAILLSHRPELFDTYVASGVDLVFTGHAHGGQFRLPFLGGVAAPNQGLFPKYASGLYTQGNTNMLVSRGIGNSIVPIRFNNRPEIIVVKLRTEE